MSAASVAEFLNSPYALIVDVRMLNFFRCIGGTAAWVVLGLVIASIFVQTFWCRYLCPYGGFLGLVSLFSPMRITRTQALVLIAPSARRRVPRTCQSINCCGYAPRVHRMFGVCSSLSSQKCADHEPTVGCAKAPGNSSVEHGRGSRDFVCCCGQLREGHRPVERESVEAGLSATRTEC